MPLKDDPTGKPEGTSGAALTLEEFEKRRNNFAAHFAGKPGEHFMGDLFRERKAFQEALKDPEFAQLAEELYEKNFKEFEIDPGTKEVKNRVVDPALKEKLYRAYLIMRRYVEKGEWEDLFQ